ncbi:MAG: 7TM diverse intracellular signaling domain-containing protein, partial [Mariprofundaceae bacterium]|nr:7TM diverse intracellular signaling domain-containing protein [Mariprofundaceae bacterium]
MNIDASGHTIMLKWRALLGFLLLLPLLGGSGLLYADELQAYQIHRALFTSNHAANPSQLPPLTDTQAWHQVAIPHNWDHFDYATGRDGWYDIDYTFDPHHKEMQAIYLPRLNMNVAVYINHKRLDSGGDFVEPIARNWNRPLIFVIPDGMLQAGHNRITIYVNAYLNSGGGLGRIYIGPEASLDFNYRWDFRTFISTTTITCAMTVSLGFSMLLFWYLRKEKMFFWFACASFLSAFYLSNHFIQNIPVSRHLWEWAFQLSIDGFSFCMMLFTHRWLKLQRQRLEVALWIYLPVSMMVLFLLPDERLMAGVNINHTLYLGIAGYVAWLLFHAWREQKNHWLLLPIAALLVNIILAVHDWQQLVFGTSNNQHYLMPLGEPMMLLVVGGFLIRHFVQLHARSEQFTMEMQEKVLQTTTQLEERHVELKKFEDKRLIECERERILQELHDGIGGQLIAAIALSESKNNQALLKQTLQDSLLDLRLVIDSLDENT